MVFNTMYTLSHEASRMGEATGPRLQDGVSLVPGRILPVPSKQLPTGTILVEPVPLAEKRGAAVYARVASGDQKKDLERQLARLVEHATAKGLSIVKSVSEIGSEYIEAALQSTSRKVVVVDEKEMRDDLVQDLIEVLTSFCRRRYGRRSAKNKAKKAMEAIEHE